MKVLIERISKSLFFGILAAVALLMLVFAVDSGRESGVPLETRTPFAWVLTWPRLIWRHILPEGASIVAVALTHVFIFSAVFYYVFSKRARPTRLP